jgi:hypothetical protein
MRGAGGTQGGIGEFILGVVMLIGGGYLFLDSVRVDAGMHWGMALFNVGGVGVTGGMVLIPFMLGVGMVFYSAKNPLGWLVMLGSVVALVFGLVSRVRLQFEQMTLFSLMTILVLTVGGAGLLLRGTREHEEKPKRLGGRDRG